MKTLHLLRHAKSDWVDETLADHERPLARRGVRDAVQLAARLKKAPIAVDLVLCSTARRTRETLEHLRPALGEVSVKFEEGLYGAAADELLNRVRRLPREVGAVLVIGHNPGLEEAAWLLLGAARAPGHFPTCALASISFSGPDWQSIREGEGEGIGFVTPKEKPKGA